MFERLCPFLKHLVELSDSIAQLVWITLVEESLPKSLYLRIIHSVDSLSLRRLSFCFLENAVVGNAVIIADENGIVHFRIPGTLTQRQNKSGNNLSGRDRSLRTPRSADSPCFRNGQSLSNISHLRSRSKELVDERAFVLIFEFVPRRYNYSRSPFLLSR